jgi:hypothetical protein
MEQALELGPCLGSGGRVVVEQREEVLQAAPAIAALDQCAQLGVVDDPELLGLLVGALQLVRGKDLGEVEKGPFGGGDRDSVDDGDVVGVE